MRQFLSLLLLLPLTLYADEAQRIMDKVDEVTRSSSRSSFSISTISSCKFGKKGKGVSCVSQPRVKKMESVQKQLGANLKDSQAVSILLEPASERGIGMLTYSYDDPDRDTESWLYLSALGRVKRMASGDGDDREPVSLFGSEFTTEDMESGKTDEYHYKILQQGPYRGRQVWVIEARPKPQRLKKTRYSKSIVWVDKERYVMLKAQSYDKGGKLWKRIVAKQLEQINDLWIARDLTIFNLRTQRLSKMKLERIALDVAIENEFLSQRTLTDFAYREQALAKLRTQLK